VPLHAAEPLLSVREPSPQHARAKSLEICQVAGSAEMFVVLLDYGYSGMLLCRSLFSAAMEHHADVLVLW
jgi:hypothetical protein